MAIEWHQFGGPHALAEKEKLSVRVFEEMSLQGLHLPGTKVLPMVTV